MSTDARDDQLAFVVIAAWDDYRDAHAAVANEATTVRNLAQERLPLSMRLILFIGAAVTIAFSCYLVIDASRLHTLMTASLAGLIALLLLLQYQLARPFQGVVAIEPTAMGLVVAEIDRETGLAGMAS